MNQAIMNPITFCMDKGVSYYERSLESDVFFQYYEIDNPKLEEIVVIPDACLDAQCCQKNGGVIVQFAGSAVNARRTQASGYEKLIAVRFRPGVIPASIKSDINEVISGNRDITQMFDVRQLKYLMSEAATVDEKVAFFADAFPKENMAPVHDITRWIIDEVVRSSGNVDIAGLAAELGYTHRYCDMVFKQSMGMTIKKFASIARMQKAIRLLQNDDIDYDAIYEELGYYDQSHLINDFKKFTTYTPIGFVKAFGDRLIV